MRYYRWELWRYLGARGAGRAASDHASPTSRTTTVARTPGHPCTGLHPALSCPISAGNDPRCLLTCNPLRSRVSRAIALPDIALADNEAVFVAWAGQGRVSAASAELEILSASLHSTSFDVWGHDGGGCTAGKPSGTGNPRQAGVASRAPTAPGSARP